MKRKTNRREFIRAAGLSATSGLMATAHPLAGASPEPQAQRPPTSKGAQLRQLLRAGEPLMVPGVADLHSAWIAEMAGFKCLFMGGSVESELYAIPNIGLITMTELRTLHEGIAPHINIPLIADVDDLGGNPLSIYRNTKLFERAGLAGVYFEDIPQSSTIRDSIDLLSKEQMVNNIRAAADARSDLVLVVNCFSSQTLDSNQKIDQAIERGMAYAEAGADVLSFGQRNLEELKRFSERTKKPLWTGNVGPGPGQVPISRMKEAGLMIAIFETPAIIQGIEQRALTELKNTGALTESNKMAMSRADRDNKLGRATEYEQLARKYGMIR